MGLSMQVKTMISSIAARALVVYRRGRTTAGYLVGPCTKGPDDPRTCIRDRYLNGITARILPAQSQTRLGRNQYDTRRLRKQRRFHALGKIPTRQLYSTAAEAAQTRRAAG